MTRLRVAVVGLGRMGWHHARVLSGRRDVELHLCDRDPTRLGAAVRAFGGAGHASPGDLAGRVEAAIVATPPADHAATSLKILAGGADVLCEKPLATTAEAAADMVWRARGRLMPGHVERFNPVVRALRRLAGRHDLRAVTISRLGMAPPGHDGVDVLLDLCVHDLDLVAHLGRSPIEDVACAVADAGAGVAFVVARLASGAAARMDASWHSPCKVREVRAWGRDVLLQADMVDGTLRCHSRGSDGDLRGATERVPIAAGEALEGEIDAFLAAVRTGGPMPIDAEDGLRAVAWAEKARAVALRARAEGARAAA